MGLFLVFLITCPGFALICYLIPFLVFGLFLAPADRYRCEWKIVVYIHCIA